MEIIKHYNYTIKNGKIKYLMPTNEEYKSLKCKIFTLIENGRGKHKKYLPYVFINQGISMISGLLKSVEYKI